MVGCVTTLGRHLPVTNDNFLEARDVVRIGNQHLVIRSPVGGKTSGSSKGGNKGGSSKKNDGNKDSKVTAGKSSGQTKDDPESGEAAGKSVEQPQASSSNAPEGDTSKVLKRVNVPQIGKKDYSEGAKLKANYGGARNDDMALQPDQPTTIPAAAIKAIEADYHRYRDLFKEDIHNKVASDVVGNQALLVGLLCIPGYGCVSATMARSEKMTKTSISDSAFFQWIMNGSMNIQSFKMGYKRSDGMGQTFRLPSSGKWDEKDPKDTKGPGFHDESSTMGMVFYFSDKRILKKNDLIERIQKGDGINPLTEGRFPIGSYFISFGLKLGKQDESTGIRPALIASCPDCQTLLMSAGISYLDNNGVGLRKLTLVYPLLLAA